MTPPLETANTSAIRSASISPMVDLACPSASIPAAAAKREIALARRRRGCGGKSVSASAGTRKAEYLFSETGSEIGWARASSPRSKRFQTASTPRPSGVTQPMPAIRRLMRRVSGSKWKHSCPRIQTNSKGRCRSSLRAICLPRCRDLDLGPVCEN